MKKKVRRRKIQIKAMHEKCPFCQKGFDPDYKNYEELSQYLSDRAKLYSSARSGFCSRHQRKLSVAIKRARHLALLPFVERL